MPGIWGVDIILREMENLWNISQDKGCITCFNVLCPRNSSPKKYLKEKILVSAQKDIDVKMFLTFFFFYETVKSWKQPHRKFLK